MDIFETKTVRTSVTKLVKLNREAIINLLPIADALPRHAVKVFFSVPGGGDWSNTNIDICNDHPVYIEWTCVDTGEEEQTHVV